MTMTNAGECGVHEIETTSKSSGGVPPLAGTSARVLAVRRRRLARNCRRQRHGSCARARMAARLRVRLRPALGVATLALKLLRLMRFLVWPGICHASLPRRCHVAALCCHTGTMPVRNVLGRLEKTLVLDANPAPAFASPQTGPSPHTHFARALGEAQQQEGVELTRLHWPIVVPEVSSFRRPEWPTKPHQVCR